MYIIHWKGPSHKTSFLPIPFNETSIKFRLYIMM